MGTKKSTVVIMVRKQRFARFGNVLADLTPFDFATPRGDKITCEPVVDDNGDYTATMPDEGRYTLECRYTNHTRGKSHIGGGPFRWIRWDERDKTNDEILENMEAESNF